MKNTTYASITRTLPALIAMLALAFAAGCSEKCGEAKYNPKKQFCAEGAVYDKCGGKEYDLKTQFCDERDGKAYKFAAIGEQVWMAENLNYKAADSTVKCYDNNPANCEKFGSLYAWETASNACPKGWHLPNDNEWMELAIFATPREGLRLKTKEGWNFKNWEKKEFIGNGTDELGFSALPSGYAYANGNFCNAGEQSAEPCNYSKGAYWWSATESGDNSGVKYILHDGLGITSISGSKMDFRSVRCLKGDSAVAKAKAAKVECPKFDSKTHFCDSRDGKVYKQINMGGNTWMAENLNHAIGGECYGGKQENCDNYGRLYAHDMARGICPEGWHLSTDKEWDELISKAGGYDAGGKKLKAKDGWNGMLGGYGNKQGNFSDAGSFGGWWCAQTFSYDYHTFGYYIQNNDIKHGNPYGNENGYCDGDNNGECKISTLSVRCVKSAKCGDVFIDPADEQACCVKTVYNDFGQFCHKGKVYDKCGEVGGGSIYDPDKQFCVDDMPGCEEGCVPEKCGGKAFNFKEQFCHNDKLYKRCGEVESSEDGTYDPETQSCKDGAITFAYGKLTDSRDNKTYKIVKIGSQTWMAENLNYETDDSNCYDNNLSNCNTYGRLYNWKTALEVCPTGWHLPSQSEWNVLTNYVGGSSTAGKYLKAKSGWGSNGEDSYGFAALPGGFGSSGRFHDAGIFGDWWSATECRAYKANESCILRINGENAFWGESDKSSLFSVRCIKDN